MEMGLINLVMLQQLIISQVIKVQTRLASRREMPPDMTGRRRESWRPTHGVRSLCAAAATKQNRLRHRCFSFIITQVYNKNMKGLQIFHTRFFVTSCIILNLLPLTHILTSPHPNFGDLRRVAFS